MNNRKDYRWERINYGPTLKIGWWRSTVV